MSGSDDLARLEAAIGARYRIERELGRGGMATVYLAEDLKHHRKVAIKVLRPELAMALGPERFLREIEIAAPLTHPHILTLIDSGEADGFLYYVMPFVDGESLRDRLRRERQLSIEEAVRIIRQVADALSYAHSVGVVHRDIKPENILFEAGHAVVTDFGIARAVSAAGGEQLTETGIAVGTPSYMSPEQAMSDRELDARTDIYSLGCVLYEMLAGDPPHTGSNPQAVIARVVTEDPTRISAIRKAVPPHVEAVLERALAKAPADRWPSATAFADGLTTEGAVPAIRPGAQDRRVQIGLAAAIAVTVVLVVVASLRLVGPLGSHPQPADPDPSVAVLPFQNLSADPEQQYFADGVADQIINALTRIPGLKVTARTSAFAFRGADLDIRTIADSLGVANVLEGTVQRAGSRVRITAQLIEAASGFHLWSETYERELTDIFQVQDDLARSIAERLRAELAGVAGGRLVGPATQSPDAHDHYLRGQQLVYQRGPQALRGAIEAFEHALRADPGYAQAYAGSAAAYALGILYLASPPDSSYSWAGRALAYADRAIALDSLSGDAYAARAYAVYVSGWSVPEAVRQAERDHLRALELQPSSVDAIQWYALHLSIRGRHAEARALHERVLELDPIAPGPRIADAFTAGQAGDYQRMLEQVRRARLIQPGLGGFGTMLEVFALLLLDRAEECLSLGIELLAHEALCLHAAGRIAEAETRIDSLAAMWSPSSPWFDADGLASYFAWTGRVDEALSWVERGLDASPYAGTTNLFVAGRLPGVWEPVLRQDEERVRSTIHQLWGEAWDRVVAESRRVALP